MKHALVVISRWLVTLLLLAVACLVALSIWTRYQSRPWTRDGHVRADVIRVSSDVGGLVTQVPVHDNQAVKAGDLLLVLDRPRHAAALAVSDAELISAKATLDLARREAARDVALGELVATETHEQNVAKVKTAAATLAQAQAERGVAQLDLERTEIHASADGVITNLDIHAGDYLAAGSQAMALIATGTLRVEGYFEETKLHCINIGDRAAVRLMGDASDLTGRVESLAAGIADDQRNDAHNLLPSIAPTFSWVRLAQRIPVRIRIDGPTSTTRMIAGRTATVRILPNAEAACR